MPPSVGDITSFASIPDQSEASQAVRSTVHGLGLVYPAHMRCMFETGNDCGGGCTPGVHMNVVTTKSLDSGDFHRRILQKVERALWEHDWDVEGGRIILPNDGLFEGVPQERRGDPYLYIATHRMHPENIEHVIFFQPKNENGREAKPLPSQIMRKILAEVELASVRAQLARTYDDPRRREEAFAFYWDWRKKIDLASLGDEQAVEALQESMLVTRYWDWHLNSLPERDGWRTIFWRPEPLFRKVRKKSFADWVDETASWSLEKALYISTVAERSFGERRKILPNLDALVKLHKTSGQNYLTEIGWYLQLPDNDLEKVQRAIQYNYLSNPTVIYYKDYSTLSQEQRKKSAQQAAKDEASNKPRPAKWSQRNSENRKILANEARLLSLTRPQIPERQIFQDWYETAQTQQKAGELFAAKRSLETALEMLTTKTAPEEQLQAKRRIYRLKAIVEGQIWLHGIAEAAGLPPPKDSEKMKKGVEAILKAFGFTKYEVQREFSGRSLEGYLEAYVLDQLSKGMSIGIRVIDDVDYGLPPWSRSGDYPAAGLTSVDDLAKVFIRNGAPAQHSDTPWWFKAIHTDKGDKELHRRYIFDIHTRPQSEMLPLFGFDKPSEGKTLMMKAGGALRLQLDNLRRDEDTGKTLAYWSAGFVSGDGGARALHKTTERHYNTPQVAFHLITEYKDGAFQPDPSIPDINELIAMDGNGQPLPVSVEKLAKCQLNEMFRQDGRATAALFGAMLEQDPTFGKYSIEIYTRVVEERAKKKKKRSFKVLAEVRDIDGFNAKVPYLWETDKVVHPAQIQDMDIPLKVTDFFRNKIESAWGIPPHTQWRLLQEQSQLWQQISELHNQVEEIGHQDKIPLEIRASLREHFPSDRLTSAMMDNSIIFSRDFSLPIALGRLARFLQIPWKVDKSGLFSTYQKDTHTVLYRFSFGAEAGEPENKYGDHGKGDIDLIYVVKDGEVLLPEAGSLHIQGNTSFHTLQWLRANAKHILGYKPVEAQLQSLREGD